MKYKLLLLCLSIFVLIFAGCSSSQQSAAEQERLAAEQARAAEQAAAAAAQAAAAEQTLAAAEEARAAAEKALAAANQQAKSAQQAQLAKAAEEAKAKADAEFAKAVEDAVLAKEQAAAAEQAKAAAEQARAAAKQAKTDARQQAKTQTVTLAAGTPIKAITSSEISTETGNTGDAITMILNEDITDGGRVIAQRGSTLKGVITDSDPGGRVKGVAMITVTLNSLALASGGEASIKTSDFSQEADSSVGRDVARTGVAAGVGAAIGAIVGGAKGAAIGAGAGAAGGTGLALATRGNDAVIAKETPITFNLTAPLTITLQDSSGRR